MSSIDERVVHMKFDNRQFEQGVRQTQKSMQDLNKSLEMKGAARGMNEVSNASRRFSLDHIANAVQGLSGKFSAMSVVGVTALATITNKAISAGAQMAKSLTIDPLKQGFQEYETNMNSIQTILANTAHEGTKLKDVTGALDELNTYSDKTIYNFSEMAKNIGTFTSAGVDLDTSTEAIKGIANLAAVSGSNSQQASTAMYQLSQAMASGKVSLMDWNSVVNAGMGGKVFQDALLETARNQGVAVDAIIKKNGSFRDSLQAGWLTSKVMTETLSKFTGDLTADQLKTMGYNAKQTAEILKMGKTAQDAATKIKTFSQLIGSLQEATGSGWAKTWQILFGDFEEAKEMFTNVSDVLGGIISKSAESRNKMLTDWDAMGGRKVLIEALSNAFDALMTALKPIGEAFREIFPPMTAKRLYDLTVGFKNFTAGLKMGAETSAQVKSTFKGIFAVLDIGRMIVQGAVGMFLKLFGVASTGSGSFLDVTSSLGDFAVGLRDSLKHTGAIEKFFNGLGKILAVPIRLIKQFAASLTGAFPEVDSSSIVEAFSGITEVFAPLGVALGNFVSQFGGLSGLFDGIGTMLADVGGDIYEAGKLVIGAIARAFNEADPETMLMGLNLGLAGGLVALVKKLIGIFKDMNPLGDIVDTVKGAVGSVTDTFASMQNTLQAATLLQIGAAIALVTASIVALSGIKADDLKKSMTTITGVFVQLGAALFAFQLIAAGKGLLVMPAVASGLILLATAVRIMAGAVKAMSEMSWDEMLRGLVGLAGVMTIMVVATKGLATQGPGLIATAGALVILSAAIKILASAVEQMGSLDWEDLAKGLVGVGGVLLALGLFTKFAAVNKGAVAQGAGLLLLATGVKVLASAVEDFAATGWEGIAKGLVGLTGVLVAVSVFTATSNPAALLVVGAGLVLIAGAIKIMSSAVIQMGKLPVEDLAKGLIGMAAALAIIGSALYAIPPTTLGTALSLVAVAGALNLIAAAMVVMGTLSWESLAISLVALGGALAILAAALIVMAGTLPGAAALVVAAGAIALLAPALVLLGTMSWEGVAKGLIGLAGALAIMAAAGYLMAPISPMLVVLGAAVALLGIGAMTAGIGVLAFAKALQILAAAGVAGAAGIVGIVKGLISTIPELMQAIGLGVIAFAKVIATAGPSLFAAMTTVIVALANAIDKTAPKVINTLGKLLVLFLDTVLKYVPKLVDSGLKLVIALFNGIAKNVGKLVDAALLLLTNFMDAIAKNLNRVTDSGAKLIIAFVNGVANAIRNNQPAMNAAGQNLASAIIDGMTAGLRGGLNFVVDAAQGVAVAALSAAKNALGIHSPSKEFQKLGAFAVQGFALGLRGNTSQVTAAYDTMKKLVADAWNSANSNVKDLEKKLYTLNQVKKKYRDHGAIRRTNAQLARAKYERTRAKWGAEELRNNLMDERKQLLALSQGYENYTQRIKDAQESLKNAIKTRDDYRKSIHDQYTSTPAITKDTDYSTYIASLKTQINDTLVFTSLIQKLRTMGLNDKAYKELLSKGTEALPFMQQILDRGKRGVTELNALGGQLSKASDKLGSSASSTLYQAAVDSAQGFVVGLQKQQKAIDAQMAKIAASMVKALKVQLGIRSPSKAFAEIGMYANEGLVVGLESYSGRSTAAAAQIGTDAVSALRKTISGLGTISGDDMNLSPVIKPVLDLTSVQADASKIGGIIGMQKLSVDGTYSSARAARNSYDQVTSAQAEGGQAVVNNDTVSFVQNNYSPKALAPIDIYRQTNNQLSVAKGALSK